MDNVELRKKFGAMVSSAILSHDSLAASGSGSSAAALHSSKLAPVGKARADANVRPRFYYIEVVLAPHFVQQVAEAFFANLDSFLGNKRP